MATRWSTGGHPRNLSRTENENLITPAKNEPGAAVEEKHRAVSSINRSSCSNLTTRKFTSQDLFSLKKPRPKTPPIVHRLRSDSSLMNLKPVKWDPSLDEDDDEDDYGVSTFDTNLDHSNRNNNFDDNSLSKSRKEETTKVVSSRLQATPVVKSNVVSVPEDRTPSPPVMSSFRNFQEYSNSKSFGFLESVSSSAMDYRTGEKTTEKSQPSLSMYHSIGNKSPHPNRAQTAGHRHDTGGKFYEKLESSVSSKCCQPDGSKQVCNTSERCNTRGSTLKSCFNRGVESGYITSSAVKKTHKSVNFGNLEHVQNERKTANTVHDSRSYTKDKSENSTRMKTTGHNSKTTEKLVVRTPSGVVSSHSQFKMPTTGDGNGTAGGSVASKSQLALTPLSSAKKPKVASSKENLIIKEKSYTVFSVIGRGGSSKVYLVYDEAKTLLAVKEVNLANTEELIKEGYLNEIRILRQLQGCERVVKMYDYEYRVEEEKLFVVMERGDSDLASVLKNLTSNKTLTSLQVKFYWSEMLKAVGEIHENGIIHSDLKPANFLLVGGVLKLIDFGIAASLHSDKTSVFKENQMGTLNFMSPEAIKYSDSDSDGKRRVKINRQTDVWSLGCILYALVYGSPPFQHKTGMAEKILAITSDKYEIKFSPLQDADLLNVLKLCLKRNPKERPHIQDLLNHPYLTKECNVEEHKGLESIVADLKKLTPNRLKKVSEVLKTLGQ